MFANFKPLFLDANSAGSAPCPNISSLLYEFYEKVNYYEKQKKRAKSLIPFEKEAVGSTFFFLCNSDVEGLLTLDSTSLFTFLLVSPSAFLLISVQLAIAELRMLLMRIRSEARTLGKLSRRRWILFLAAWYMW